MNYIKPLTIGSKTFSTNLIQGPLAGYSCAPLRKLVWQYGDVGYCCSEMISAKDLIHRKKRQSRRYTWRDPQEKVLCYQISGNTAAEVALATRMLTQQGADLIDLNAGCPKAKIRKKGAGSKLLSEPQRLRAILSTMRENTDLPLTLKIRVDGDSGEENNLVVAEVAEQSGVDALIVHGRHWRDDYAVPCHVTQIKQLVSTVAIPVIANGDGKTAASIQHLLTSTGCAGIMISRAGVGQPWLFSKLAAELSGKVYPLPSRQAIADLFLTHVSDLIALESDKPESEKFAVLQARKLAKYYARQMQLDTSFVTEVNQTHTFAELQRTVETHIV